MQYFSQKKFRAKAVQTMFVKLRLRRDVNKKLEISLNFLIFSENKCNLTSAQGLCVRF